jgi:hypothetical protein
MHETEFVWFIPNDNNRLMDANALRKEFLNGKIRVFRYPISVLEVLIALSRRAAWNGSGQAGDWAWKLIQHLHLQRSSDPLTGRKLKRVDDILYKLIWRTYEPNGEGGFFPLREPKEDQTKLEIWHQMSAYIIENWPY